MVQIKWTLQAKDNLKEIKEFISKDSIVYAQNTIKNIRIKTEILKSFLQIGREVPEYEDKTIRELIEGNYRIIYYTPNNKIAYILAVIHGAMDFTKITLVIPKKH